MTSKDDMKCFSFKGETLKNTRTLENDFTVKERRMKCMC
jgi:hypothetical protein